MKIGFQNTHLEKEFECKDRICRCGDEKWTIDTVCAWITATIAVMPTDSPFTLKLGSLNMPLVKNDHAVKLVRQLVSNHLRVSFGTYDLHETVGALMAPDKKSFERVWTHDGATLRSGETVLSIKEFDSRLQSMYVNCILRLTDGGVHEKEDVHYTLQRKDANMEVCIDVKALTDRDILKHKLSSISVLIGAPE